MAGMGGPRDTHKPAVGRPLAGRKVVVTRAAEQSGGFAAMLKSAGAEVVVFPTIETVQPESTGALDRAIGSLPRFDYIIFTSANAVKFFFRRLHDLGRDVRELSGVRVVVVGPKTAKELEVYGLRPDVSPTEFKAEGVLDALSAHDLSGKKILFPRAEVAREVLPEKLTERGAEVVVAVAYRTVKPSVDPAYINRLFTEGGVSALTFTSSSTVRNFVEIIGEELKGYLAGVCVVCIGPVTADTCRELGIPVTLVPDDYTVDAMLQALTDYFKRR